MRYEDLKDLKYGDQIIIGDPATQQDTAYVLMSYLKEDGSYYFVSGYGASLLIKDQKTIDGFNVRKINDSHPSCDQQLSVHGKTLGSMLTELEKDDTFMESMKPPFLSDEFDNVTDRISTNCQTILDRETPEDHGIDVDHIDRSAENQIKFVDWLKEKGLYNDMDTTMVMLKMFAVWDEVRKENDNG